jgi:hypothetical protein
MPLDVRHFARLNVDLERAAWPWKAVFRQRHNVVAWAERKSETTVTIRCKRCDRALLVRHGKDRAWKRRPWTLGSFLYRPGPGRTDHNDSLNAGTPTGVGFSKRNGSIHQEEREKQRDVST